MDKRNYVNLNVNPCKMCMPMGGSLAFKGIEGSMILMHGSQGCSTYIRRHMATHFNEPVDIASTSLSENGTIYGGAKNLKQGIKNVMRLYEPNVIGVLTTCLAETIGEDVKGIIEEFQRKHDIGNLDIIPVSTPGYGATHYEGFFSTIRSIVKYYTEKKTGSVEANGTINIVAGDLSAADIREVKRILDIFQVKYTLIPDVSDTLDAPHTQEFTKIPAGGTKVSDIKGMPGAKATIEMAVMLEDRYSPGVYLKEYHGVPLYRIPLPIGLYNTDKFITALMEITGQEMPPELKAERGRMLDGMVDSHKYNGEGKALIFGNPEIVYSVTELCRENGIAPLIIATGAKISKLDDVFDQEESLILNDIDFETIHTHVKELKPNIMIGNSDGKFILEKEKIPLIRIGFPVHDHIGAQRKLHVGYTGSMRFLDEITNCLLDLKHSDYRERIYEEFYDKKKVGGADYA